MKELEDMEKYLDEADQFENENPEYDELYQDEEDDDEEEEEEED